MPTAAEKVLDFSPAARKILADMEMEMRRRECISKRGPQCKFVLKFQFIY